MPSGHVAPKEVIPMHPQSTQFPLPEERWLPVVGYEGLYEVSDLGDVRSVRRTTNSRAGHVLKATLNNWGYIQVHLSREGRVIWSTVHRLVLAAFVRPPAVGEQGNHINGVKTDNRLSNLEWVTPSGNIRHAHRTDLAPRGERSSRAKLTEAQVLQIRALGKNLTGRELARRFGVSCSAISLILNRKHWQHV